MFGLGFLIGWIASLIFVIGGFVLLGGPDQYYDENVCKYKGGAVAEQGDKDICLVDGRVVEIK